MIAVLQNRKRGTRCIQSSLLAMIGAGILIFVAGCKDAVLNKTLPAPLRDKIAYEMDGNAFRTWRGNQFEFGNPYELHCIVIRGIAVPQSGQPGIERSRDRLHHLLERKQIRVSVVARDELMREIADVYLIDPEPVGKPEKGENIAIKMIALGFAWYDGSQFEGAAEIREAQEIARDGKVGFWAEAGVIPSQAIPTSPSYDTQ